ncbi:LamG domain-containing protein [Kribbella deserti]|uniref:LamG domain-containing protein n=1 Tax=Kribbella deserti TaxID=1926257 RepID=A0ABV6QEF4_9ACTN
MTLTEEGKTLSLRWPTALPAPVVEDDSLTYHSVLPDVDLKISVFPNHFTQVLVVHTPAAAKQEGLDQVSMAVDAPDLDLKRTANGGINAVDEFGNTVFEAPTPIMWDSRGNGAADGPGGDDRTESPVTGDKVAKMAVELKAGHLSVKPSEMLINDPAAVYPLHVDPGFTGVPAGHAMIDRAYPSSSYWNWADDQSVGYQNFDAWSHKRLMYSFYIAKIAGTDVTRAVFRANQVYSASCTSSEIQAWETSRFTSTATWSNASGSGMWLRKVASAVTPGSGRSGCESGRVTEFSVTNLLNERVGLRANYAYLGLRAADESNPMVWKRFTANATLGIEYNTPPDQPTANDLTIGMGNTELPCVTSGTNYPTTGAKPTPLKAYLTDKDGPSGDLVTGIFEVWEPGGARKFAGFSEKLPPGRDFSPINEVHLLDGVYWWHARVTDDTSVSAWSPPCYFRVDNSVPPGPIPKLITPAEDCPEVPDDEPKIVGPCYRIGQSITFDIIARVELASQFAWSVNTPEIASVAAPLDGGERARVTTALTNFGPTRIYVWAKDKAGHWSPYSYVSLYIIDSTRTGGWRIDEGQGSTLNDTLGSSPNTPLINVPSVTWGSGDNAAVVPTDRAVIMNGATDGTGSTSVTTAKDIVNTSQSFAVSTRLKLSSAYLTRQVAVSEDRASVSGFTLGIHSQTADDGDRTVLWQFCMADPSSPTSEFCAYGRRGYDGDWTHLAGVYSGASRRLELYLDGVLIGTRVINWTTKPAIDGDGSFRIGRSVVASTAKNYMRGYIDDVNVFNGYVNNHTIFRLYKEK